MFNLLNFDFCRPLHDISYFHERVLPVARHRKWPAKNVLGLKGGPRQMPHKYATGDD